MQVNRYKEKGERKNDRGKDEKNGSQQLGDPGDV